MMKKLTTLALACAISLLGFGDVLCWQVNGNTTVDGISIQQFLVPYPSDDDHFPAARVKLVSSDGTSSTILRIYFGDGIWEDGSLGVELMDNGGGYWGAGNPTGIQSETGYNTIGTIQDALQGNTPSYPSDVMEALFVMELGYNTWDDGAGDWVWQTLAQSAPELYEELVNDYMYASGDIAPSNYASWTPDFYTAPEPSILHLCIIGIGILMLRRKTNNV